MYDFYRFFVAMVVPLRVILSYVIDKKRFLCKNTTKFIRQCRSSMLLFFGDILNFLH